MKEWSRKAGESKISYECLPININNKILGITSYYLAQFVNVYLQTNRPELSREELDTPEELEKLILMGSKVRENGDID